MIVISNWTELQLQQRFQDRQSVCQLNPLVLAAVGDAVYSLYMRTYTVSRHDFGAHALHEAVAKLVKASAQAEAFFSVEELLTPEETEIARRGRNAHPGSVPHNANLMDYRVATALEAVFGYLYLTGQQARMDTLIETIVERKEK